MPENFQKNINKSSKISDLSSKIREAESDLSISRGIQLRKNSMVNHFKPINGLVLDKSGQDLKEVSELHILRLKQIETAQRLKETLRRNVDLMTELQKARGVVRSLEKKISLLERGEGINLFHNNSKETNSQCNHCPKQQEEINKLKLHIVELNNTFQKRWDDTQKELLNAKNSLSDVSNKLLESLNNNNQLKINQEIEQFRSINGDDINEFMEENLNFDKILESYKNSNINIRRNGSETQSPSTYKLSRPSSSNFSNDLNVHHQNLNAYSRINSNNHLQYNEYSRLSETPRASFINTNISSRFLNHNQENGPNILLKHSRPQSERQIKYPVHETNRTVPDNHNHSNSGFYQTINNGVNSDPATRIRSLDSITINPGLNSHANSFPPGLAYSVSNRRYDLNPRDSVSNSFSNLMVYPNTYSSNILSSHNKNQIPNNSFVSGVEMFNSSKIKNSIFPGSNNISYDSQSIDNNSIMPNQNECENPTGISNYNSLYVNESNNIKNSTSPSSNSKIIIEPARDQTVNNCSTTSFSDNFNEYTSSPITKDSLNEHEIDQNTYGNIRKTLEELKKTQDQRVQQLKDDREKLLRAVLNDLQEMKDFKTNLNSIKVNQEKMTKTAPKGLFSLEDSSKYDI